MEPKWITAVAHTMTSFGKIQKQNVIVSKCKSTYSSLNRKRHPGT